MLLLPPCISLLPKNSSYTHVQRNHPHNWTLNIAVARYWSEPKWPWSHQSYGQCLVYRCAIMHNTFDRWRSVLEETKFYRSFTWWSNLHLTSLSVSQTSISPLLLVCQKKNTCIVIIRCDFNVCGYWKKYHMTLCKLQIYPIFSIIQEHMNIYLYYR